MAFMDTTDPETRLQVHLDRKTDGALMHDLTELIHVFLHDRAAGPWAISLDEETQAFRGMYDAD